eukprot:3174110-Pleurochrysis_carterae.AAC.1
MSYKWCHPVATLPSDEWGNTSHSQNDGNSANRHPFLTVLYSDMSRFDDLGSLVYLYFGTN